MLRFLNTLLILASVVTASAQVKVSGRITDLQNKPVGDVIVKVVSGSKTLAFTTTNAQGIYSVEVKDVPQKTATITFNHISFEKEAAILSLNEKSVKQDMLLTPKSISLKEVKVKADPLRQRGDTLSLNLASFLGKGDVTLEDGLKRLPGVDVSKSGGISYMGRPISQFNIEGMDLLGGQYNLATRNIPADYVTNVEIVRNHHSRKVEKDIPSNEVSMNIKLNKKAKFKPFGQEEMGVGLPEHWLLGVTGMMFTDNFQTIGSLKGGNYKDFAKADMIDHFGGSDISTPATSLFRGFDGGRPPQGEYLYQRNGMATLNGIRRTDSATTVKVNANYSYHRATNDISRSSTYLTGNGDYVTVSEETSPLSKLHLPKLSVNYQKNADNMYLDETFLIKGKFEQNEGHVLANLSQVEQHRRTSSFEIANDLFWMRKTSKGTRRHVQAKVSFKRTPTLRLSFNSLPYGGMLEGTFGQTAQSSTLTMVVGSSFNIPIGKAFRLNLPVSVNAMYDDLETFRVATSEENHIRGWAFTPSANPGFEIHSRNRRFYLSAGIGAALKGLYYNKINYTKPVLNPSLGINYTFSANSKLSFNTNYTTHIGDMMTLLTEPMQVDYRTVQTSSGIIGESNNWNTSIGWKWQLPMQYFTLSLAASHNEGKHNTLNSQSISGIDISNSALLHDARSRSTHFSVSSTKNIPSLFAKFGVEANYGFGSGEQAINEDIIETHSENYNIRGNVAITPVTWLELHYNFSYGWSQSRYADSKNTVTSLVHSGAVHIFPIPTLDLSLDYDHVRRQITADHYKNMSLFNASAQYKLKRLVLSLELTNLFNQRNYAYTVFNGINTYSFDYGLCGRTVMMRMMFKL